MKKIISTALISLAVANSTQAETLSFSTTVEDSGCGFSVNDSTGGIRLSDQNNSDGAAYGYIYMGLQQKNVALTLHPATDVSGSFDLSKGYFILQAGGESIEDTWNTSMGVFGEFDTNTRWEVQAWSEESRTDLGVGTHEIQTVIEMSCTDLAQ